MKKYRLPLLFLSLVTSVFTAYPVLTINRVMPQAIIFSCLYLYALAVSAFFCEHKFEKWLGLIFWLGMSVICSVELYSLKGMALPPLKVVYIPTYFLIDLQVLVIVRTLSLPDTSIMFFALCFSLLFMLVHALRLFIPKSGEPLKGERDETPIVTQIFNEITMVCFFGFFANVLWLVYDVFSNTLR